MHAQLDRPEALFGQGLYFLGPLLGRVNFAGRGVDGNAPVGRQPGRVTAQHPPQWLALGLALDVPERGFEPVIAPAQVAGLANALSGGFDVGRVEADDDDDEEEEEEKVEEVVKEETEEKEG